MLLLLLSSAVLAGGAKLQALQGCWAFSKGHRWVCGMRWLKRTRDALEEGSKVQLFRQLGCFSSSWCIQMSVVRVDQ